MLNLFFVLLGIWWIPTSQEMVKEYVKLFPDLPVALPWPRYCLHSASGASPLHPAHYAWHCLVAGPADQHSNTPQVRCQFPESWDKGWGEIGVKILENSWSSWKFVVIFWELSISRLENFKLHPWCRLWLKIVLVGWNLKLRCLLCMTPCKVPGICMMSLHGMGDHQKSGTCLGPSILRTAICACSQASWGRKTVDFDFEVSLGFAPKCLPEKVCSTETLSQMCGRIKSKLAFRINNSRHFSPREETTAGMFYFLFQAGPTAYPLPRHFWNWFWIFSRFGGKNVILPSNKRA